MARTTLVTQLPTSVPLNLADLEMMFALPTRPDDLMSMETQMVPLRPPELEFFAQAETRPLYLRMVPWT